jgi:hypothetical protein
MPTDLLECPVCLETMNDPHVLPGCGHTFCKNCIERTAAGQRQLRCPTCRRTGRADGIQPNYALRNLISDVAGWDPATVATAIGGEIATALRPNGQRVGVNLTSLRAPLLGKPHQQPCSSKRPNRTDPACQVWHRPPQTPPRSPRASGGLALGRWSPAGPLTQGAPGVPQDPFAPLRGPLESSLHRESAAGNAPALSARTFGSTVRPTPAH